LRLRRQYAFRGDPHVVVLFKGSVDEGLKLLILENRPPSGIPQ
jgi:hypothetical protein